MKKAFLIIPLFLSCLLFSLPSHAQLNIGRKLQNKLNQKLDQQVDKKIDAALDKPLKAGAGQKEAATDAGSAEPGTAAAAGESSSPSVWTKYDFVPGDEVLFEDNLAGEENGEFPSHWDLVNGNAEVASFGNENVINLVSSGTGIRPLMKNVNWLPETSTIEMDLFFDSDNPNIEYEIFLFDDEDQYKEELHGDFRDPIEIGADRMRFNKFGSTSTELEAAGTKNQWRHVAIALNKRSLKVYLDQYRLINVPSVSGKATGLRVETRKNIDGRTMVKNVFIAEGGKKLYDQVMADGKIVTHGIKFDTNKAVIRPESVGTLQSIVKLMQDQADLKFSVEGHTDSDGDDAANMKLSQQRADAVKAYFIEQGISPERLVSKGWGETKPLSKNATAETKRNNRRVEFVKL